eukprot:170403-Hanusia_phi.AAC.1
MTARSRVLHARGRAPARLSRARRGAGPASPSELTPYRRDAACPPVTYGKPPRPSLIVTQLPYKVVCCLFLPFRDVPAGPAPRVTICKEEDVMSQLDGTHAAAARPGPGRGRAGCNLPGSVRGCGSIR